MNKQVDLSETDGVPSPAAALGLRRLRVRATQRPPKNSDDDLALAFAEKHCGELRYVSGWDVWLLRGPYRWSPDVLGAVQQRVRLVVRTAANRLTGRDAKALASAKTNSSVERLARSDSLLAATTEQWDTDRQVLNTPSGVVDLLTGSLRKQSADDYFTKVTEVGPGTGCARWLHFIDQATGSDKALAAYLQRVAGYMLTGETSEQAMFFLYGTGANGKSVFVSTLAGIMGDYSGVAPIEALTESRTERHPTELAMLRGRRLVTAVETEQGKNWAEGRIKALTGGDRIAARFMRQDYFDFQPDFKLLVAGNHKPNLRTVDEAISRRFQLIPFNVTVPASQREADLVDRLKTERPGILQWMIDGCLMWREQGLSPPEAVVGATRAYLESEDSVGSWIEECCLVEGSASLANLYRSWSGWARSKGEIPETNKWLSKMLEARGFERRKIDKGVVFRGLSLQVTHYSHRPNADADANDDP
jgi:putative DNA primase/helicase